MTETIDETIEVRDLLHGKITGVIEKHTPRGTFMIGLRIQLTGVGEVEIDIHAARGGELVIRLVDEE